MTIMPPRPLKSDENPSFHKLYSLCDKELFSLHHGNSDHRSEPDAWYLDVPTRITVIEANGNLVAFCIYSVQPIFEKDVDGEILDVWVDQSYRKQGLASTLVEAAFVEQKGVVGFQVHKGNEASYAFWTHFFTEHDISFKVFEQADDEGSEIYKFYCRLAP